MMRISTNRAENLTRRLKYSDMNHITRKKYRNGLMIVKSTENKINGGNKDGEQKREDKIFCNTETDGTFVVDSINTVNINFR